MVTEQVPGKLTTLRKEVIIQFLIAIAFFFATVVGHSGEGISWFRLAYLVSYLLAALAINYILLPKFYYRKKYWKFALGVVIVMMLTVVFKELVLEKIFFPDTRGLRFSSSLLDFTRLLPMLMLFVGFKFAWDAQHKQGELDQLKTAITESQLQFLKSQINPHFLFNSLNNLYSYALEQSEKTPQIILELSSLLRYMLYDCREEVVPLEKEVQYLNDFVKLQSLQIEDRGQVNFTSTGTFKGQFVAPLILIVFVENCFKHSTSSLSDKIVIDIDLTLDGSQLKLKCMNTYAEQKNTESLTKGIGLQNVITRLDLLYPGAYQLEKRTEGEKYIINLTVDL